MRPTSRDDFTQRTKRVLADRVAWRCSFPGCRRITIGPRRGETTNVANLGEAAHIYGASPRGPRPNPSMSPEERKLLANGIWMCRHHARLVDSDSSEYSAGTLRQWKQTAESIAYQELMRLQSPPEIRRTMVQLGRGCVFSGTWSRIRPGSWRFIVNDFVLGNISSLRQYCLDLNEGRIERADRFVVVESQGDGRVVGGPALLAEQEGRDNLLTLAVASQEPRRPPNRIGGDLLLSSEGDFVVRDGAVGFVSGRDAGMQSIFLALSIKPGELFYYRQAGSYFSRVLLDVS